MAAEEDKKFDAVLGGFLINDLRIRAGDLHCPESDTLAAYHERSLLPEEMNLWKEHIVGCARCQAILAELEATDSIPLQIGEKEQVLTVAAAPVRDLGEASPVHEGVPAVLPAKPRVTPISRGVRWQWLAPAGAIAAGLLVWIGWHENRKRQVVKTPTEVTTAKLEPPAAPPPVTGDDQQAISNEQVSRISKDQDAIGSAAAEKPVLEAKNPKQLKKSDLRGRVSRSEPQADKANLARADTALDSLADANRAQGQPAQDAKAPVAGAMSQTVEVQASAENAQPQSQQIQQNLQAQQNQHGRNVSGPNPSTHAEQTKKSKDESRTLGYRAAAAAPASPPPAPAPSAASSDSAAERLAVIISPYVISAPDKKILWRVGHLGMIEFSSDGGASWSRQISNVSSDLTAGSAPSEKVCWIVGRAGTVLLTTDAGALWTSIHSPLAEDFGGVRASDALHASIWNVGNTKVFETSDGGATWRPAVSQ